MRTRLIPLLVLAACGSQSTSDKPSDKPVDKPAESTKPVEPTKPTNTYAIAVVFETQHLWLGNDTWWDGVQEQGKTEGAYKQLKAGLDLLARSDLPGAKVELISYGSEAKLRWSGDLKDLSGDKIGTQASLSTMGTSPEGKKLSVLGDDPVPGIDLAITDLAKSTASKKLILILGDAAQSDGLPTEQAALGGLGIDVIAVYLQEPTGMMPGDPNGWKKLTATVKSVDAPEGLPPAMGAVIATWTH
jgi:hypothetical protein